MSTASEVATLRRWFRWRHHRLYHVPPSLKTTITEKGTSQVESNALFAIIGPAEYTRDSYGTVTRLFQDSL
jgi:hypothetical protein